MIKKDIIQFGTDGWRGKIADEFTFPNVKRITQAVCDHLHKSSKSRLILIGYDHRFFSKEFARTAARIATANRFHVELSKTPLTSPALSYQVHKRKAAIGIMITASHNPFNFNGFKLKGVHGGSVDETTTKIVESHLDESPVKWGDALGKETDFVSGYLAYLKKNVRIKLGKSKIIIDSMHGPSGNLLGHLLGKRSDVSILHVNQDPYFGGVNPEPIEKNLLSLKQAVIKEKAAMGIALDGDGDRIGLIDDKGRYLPPQTVMPLLLLYLLEGRKLKGKVVQTVSMGYLPSKIAQAFRLGFEEVSVGFKYIAERMLEEKVLLGGEESGGFGIGLWSPERDGILCGLLFMEMLAVWKKPLSVLVDQLYSRFGKSVFKRVDFYLDQPLEKAAWTQRIVEELQKGFPDLAIKTINPMDGVKIILDDDSWVLMRPSGTEPLIRTYAESSSEEMIDRLLKEADRLVHLKPPAQLTSKSSGKNKPKKKPVAQKK